MPAPLPPPGYVRYAYPHSNPPSSSADNASVCALKDTLTHTRFHLSLRTLSTPAVYHRLLLFRITKPSEDSGEGGENKADELYCMEQACPHLGAPLSHAEVEVDDIEDTRAVGESPEGGRKRRAEEGREEREEEEKRKEADASVSMAPV